MARKWKYLAGCALAFGAALFMQAQFTPPGGGGGSGSVTSVGLAGTANQITVTGTSPITNSGSWTLSLPANLSGITGLTPGADFTLTQNSVAAITSVSSGAVVNTIYLSAGHTLLGTTTDLGAVLTVADTRSTSPRGILSLQNSSDTVGARVGFAKSRGTAASPTIVVTGDTLGRSMYRGYDGSNYLEMASIEAVATGTIASTRVPTYLAFSTATDATPSVLTERMRIDSAGGVTISSLTSGRIPLASTGGLLADSNIYQSSGRIGIGPTSYTPSGGTSSVLDATPTSGATAKWIGHDGSGTYSGAHISATTSNLTVVAGSIQGSTDLISVRNSSGALIAQVPDVSGNVIGAQVISPVGTGKFGAGSYGARISSDSAFGISGTTSQSGGVDTALSRISAGVIGIGTGAVGSVAGGLQVKTTAIGGCTLNSNTLCVTDTTATTGATRVNIGLGAADSSTTNIFTIAGTQKFAGNNTTAAVAGVIGATCPAVTCTAAYTWVQAVSSDGSTVYFPVWK